MLETICANCSSDSAKPSSLPRCSSSSSSMASESTCGVTSSSVLRSSASFLASSGRMLRFWFWARMRGDLPLLEVGLGEDLAVHLDEDLFDDLGAERQAGRRGEPQREEATQDQAADILRHHVDLSTLASYAISVSSVRTPLTWSNSLPGVSQGIFVGLASSSRLKPGATVPLVARCVHQDDGFGSVFRPTSRLRWLCLPLPLRHKRRRRHRLRGRQPQRRGRNQRHVRPPVDQVDDADRVDAARPESKDDGGAFPVDGLRPGACRPGCGSRRRPPGW